MHKKCVPSVIKRIVEIGLAKISVVLVGSVSSTQKDPKKDLEKKKKIDKKNFPIIHSGQSKSTPPTAKR